MCSHKFFGHHSHLDGDLGLMPNWAYNCLIIGTFNPENLWVPDNHATYFYGRSRYFWRILPKFTLFDGLILDDELKIEFLQNNKIGLTDLLKSVEDADINNPNHVNLISSYLDRDLENFHNLTWNTHSILYALEHSKVSHVYFTKIGVQNLLNPPEDSFEGQMRLIEQYCVANNIYCNRLFTPSGMGLRQGTPRENKLINKWYNENGADHFPFLDQNFDINHYPFN